MAITYNEKFKAFRFLVEFSVGTIGGAFSSFSGIRMKVDVVSGRAGNEKRGVQENVPGITHFDNVTLTRGVVGDNDFMDWILAAAPSDTAPPTGEDMRRDITVVALDDQGNRGIEWTLLNALPVGYTVSPMDANKSAVMTESIEFAIEGFSRKTNPLPEPPVA